MSEKKKNKGYPAFVTEYGSAVILNVEEIWTERGVAKMSDCGLVIQTGKNDDLQEIMLTPSRLAECAESFSREELNSWKLEEQGPSDA